MDIQNSGTVNNRTRIRSILIAGSIYLALALVSMGLLLIPAALIVILTYALCRNEIAAMKGNAFAFKKTFPFRAYGASFGDFEHVFCHEKNISSSIIQRINQEIERRMEISGLRNVSIEDIDKDLLVSDSRDFYEAYVQNTMRGTSIHLIVKVASIGQMQSVHWWALAGGYLDKDKFFNFCAYSPLSIWFWFIPYIKRNHNILSNLRTIYSASYNDFDVLVAVRCIHDVVFDALVIELESHGIDTSTLKLQQNQVMNINISGGRVNLGNVVQGAVNKVVSTAAGSKAT